MKVIQDFILPGTGVRTGRRMPSVEGLVIHWIGVCQPEARKVRGSFTGTNLGTQYISDYKTGDILQVMPEEEAANHVGAKQYTATKEAALGVKSPNLHLVGVECCIGDKEIPEDWALPGVHMELGRPSDAQYRGLVEFVADFLTRRKLGVDRLFRHYDITGKLCHVWFCKDEARWLAFRDDVAAAMRGEIDMTKEEMQAMVDAAVDKALAEREAEKVAAAQKTSTWAEKSWGKATAKRTFDGTSPGGNLTREQAATVLDRLGLLD